ncbi:MAG TPA: dTMP kinase [Acidimicrobiia bacterium]|nr:dTMP kinase [Acidimicrobiia bacterium]
MAGRFVVLEGGDGSGKSTQARCAAVQLRARGLAVYETFEPGATAAGAVIRELLLHGHAPVAPVTEALLMAADRAQHVHEQIAPALARGEWVVCDRFVPSSLVYQGIVRGLGAAAVETMNEVATAGVCPDVVVVLDVPDDVVAARTDAPRDRLESEGDAFHAAVRDAYRFLAAERGWVVVDGTGDVDTVAARVWARLEPLLAG